MSNIRDEQLENRIKELGAEAPRVTLADFEANIECTEIVKHVSASGQILRWAVITTKSGYSLSGKPSCSASNENDREEIGEQIAVENARRELWPLMGYALKEKLA